MDEKIIKVLENHGLTIDDLTEQELKELKREIKLKERGVCILDGVLSNSEIYYRRFKPNKN